MLCKKRGIYVFFGPSWVLIILWLPVIVSNPKRGDASKVGTFSGKSLIWCTGRQSRIPWATLQLLTTARQSRRRLCAGTAVHVLFCSSFFHGDVYCRLFL